MTKDEIQMREYEVLTQEILEHQKRREQLFLFTVVALGVILGFALKEEGIPFMLISFIPYLLIFNFCRSTEINSGHIITIGTYIRHFIESNYEDSLHRQSVWNDAAEKDNKDKISKGYWFSFCFISSIGICVGITILSVIQNKLEPLNIQGLLAYIFFGLLQGVACLFCILKGVMLIHWSNMNQRKRKYWNKYWMIKKVKERKERCQAKNRQKNTQKLSHSPTHLFSGPFFNLPAREKLPRFISFPGTSPLCAFAPWRPK